MDNRNDKSKEQKLNPNERHDPHKSGSYAQERDKHDPQKSGSYAQERDKKAGDQRGQQHNPQQGNPQKH